MIFLWPLFIFFFCRITHTVILDDPFPDPSGLDIPIHSPEPTREMLDVSKNVMCFIFVFKRLIELFFVNRVDESLPMRISMKWKARRPKKSKKRLLKKKPKLVQQSSKWSVTCLLSTQLLQRMCSSFVSSTL